MNINGYIEDKRNEIDLALEDIIPRGNNAEIAARYVLLAKGHRWRPILSLALADGFDNPYDNLVKLSCATECMHAASIILDDLPSMDDAKIRRGVKTCHIEYGEDMANLAVVRLINEGWNLINENSPEDYRAKLLKEGYNVGVIMVDGQVNDLTKRFNKKEDIFKMYMGKSGGLLYLSSLFGLFHKDFFNNEIYDFARNLGVAYQIADDLLDVNSSEGEIGKDIGQDEDKITSVKLLGIQKSREMAMDFKSNALAFVKGKEVLENLINKIVKID